MKTFCDKCRSELKHTIYMGGEVGVEPCQKCIEKAENDAYDEGYEAGVKQCKILRG